MGTEDEIYKFYLANQIKFVSQVSEREAHFWKFPPQSSKKLI